MKIVLVTLSTPTYNNVRAASALPYHLMKGAGDGASFMVYSYNINGVDEKARQQVEKELGVTIRLLKQPRWMRWMLRLRLTMLRVFLRYPYLAYLRLKEADVERMKQWQPDKVWLYGEEISGLGTLFPEYPCMVLMPDCESLFYHRLLAKRFATRRLPQVLRYAWAYNQYRSMERDRWLPQLDYYFVGEQDAAFYQGIVPQAKAHFMRHPLYAYSLEKTIQFCHPKVKILVAGRYDLYMQETSDEVFQMFLSHTELAAHYELTFLGKGWEPWGERLRQGGYATSVVRFAPDYIEELQKHDIQLTPIAVGTGTKGKVLDALANGLLVIGTPFALENIAVQSGVSCVEYRSAEELLHVLLELPSHVEDYEQMAEAGRAAVLSVHDNQTIANHLFSL